MGVEKLKQNVKQEINRAGCGTLYDTSTIAHTHHTHTGVHIHA
jgi:hypothetical protein